MDTGVTGIIIVSIIFGAVFVVPALVLRPVMIALANRIAGKYGNVSEIKLLKDKVHNLEEQLSSIATRVSVMEDGHEFSKKLLEDVINKPATGKLDDKTSPGH